MNKVKIEFDGSKMKKRVDKTKKHGARTTRSVEMVPVKDPKCWEIITIENSLLYSPGQRLTKKQVESLCRSAKYEVEIGGTGQYTAHKSRY